MTIIEDFRGELRILLNGVVKERLTLDTCFKVIERLEKTLSFPNNIQGSHTRAIRVLRTKSKNIGKLISDKELERLLEDLLIDLKYGDEERVTSEIDKHIVGLFNKLRGMESEKHLFIVPIMHLNLLQDITIGDSVLVNLNEQNLASLEAKYGIKLRFGDKDFSQTINEMVKRNETSVFAIVVVEAPDNEKALELAEQKADTCLNVLRLYNSTAPYVVRDEFRSGFPRGMVHVNIDKRRYGEMLGSVNLVVNIPTINLEIINKMKQAGFDILNKLLCKGADELTPLQKDVLTAIFWFGNAVKEKQRNMKFIKSVIALETLLVPDGGIGKGDRLSKRFVSILYTQATNDEKKEVYLDMQSLYDVRNSIIHSGEGYVYDDDLVQIMYWTQATIQFLLQYVEKFNDIFQLIEKEFPVDENLYSGL